jgi:hypothetical protein
VPRNLFRSFSGIFFLLPLVGPSPTRSHSTLLYYCLVEMISKTLIALSLLALASSVNAAAIPRQLLLGLVVREGLY